MRSLGCFAIGLLICCGLASAAAATDLASMSQADIRALQERLTDAKCYSGPIDGAANTAVTSALKACPVMDPILSIETGMHTVTIKRIGVDRDCKLLATGSDDKTVRLWSLPEGRLLRTLRVPSNPGDGGKVYAVAMSPDGRLIAVGGWDAHYDVDEKNAVYLFDTATGALRARIGSFGAVINHLAFSLDGRYVAAALGGKDGLRVIDVAQSREIASDTNYGAQTYSAEFTPDGRLFTGSDDGFLRAYDSGFRLVKKVKATGGVEPDGLAIDPSGKYIAAGYYETRAVEVYRTSDLGREYVADTSKLTGNGNLVTMSWSRDGRKLVVGGRYRNQGTPVVVWERPGPGRAGVEKPVSDNTIMSLAPCGDGFAFGTADPVFGLLDSDEKVTLSKRSVDPDFREMGDAFAVSNNGGQVRFALEEYGKRPMLFDVSRATLDTSGDRPDLAPPRLTGLAVTDWKYSTAPKLNGKTLPLDQYEAGQSLAIAADRKQFVLGTPFWLRAFDAQGKVLWRKPVPGIARTTNLTGDGRLVVAAYADGTVRWHRLSDGQELLALFVNKDDLRWVAWTPSGYYMAAPGGEDMIGWHVNRGWEQGADFFPGSRFRERFSRPDIVQQVLLTLDEGKAVEAANRAANIRTDNSSVTSKLPPVIRIISPADGTVVRDKEVTVEYELRSPSGLPVDAVEVMIDGHPARGFNRVNGSVGGARVERVVVTVPAGNVELGLFARSGALAGEVSKVRLRWGGQAESVSSDDQFKPKLYGVIVGVSNYANPSLTLKYAAKDAKDFAAALQAQKGGLYRDVELTVLTDADATSIAVRRALTWLNRSVTSRDVGVVFLAGHGQSTANRYYYLTSDTDLNEIEDTALDGVTLRDRTRLASKVLVFLDTCYAGNAMAPTTRGVTDINMIVNDLSSTENGVVTYASSTGREVSMEDPSWGNGAFTKALIEGLGTLGKARADMGGKGVITTAGLDFWISERVKELTHGSQHPVMIRPPTVPDFPMFVVK